MHVLVIGGGVAGITTAWFLREAGVRVSVLEARPAAAMGASGANGGMLHSSHAAPWNAPGVERTLLRSLLQSDTPLRLHASALPRLGRWGMEFLWHSASTRYHRHARLNAELAVYSLRQLRALQARTHLSFAFRETGIVKIFRNARTLQAQTTHTREWESVGVRYETWTTSRLMEAEPALRPIATQLAGALFYPEDAVGDVEAFTHELLHACRARGVRWHADTEVRGWRLHGGHINGVETNQGPMAADAVVLASGHAAPRLLHPLGIRVPIVPVKGYSLTLSDPPAGDGIWPRLPLIDDEHKVVITPLGDRLRLAGTAEFAGETSTLPPRALEQVLRGCRKTLPHLPASVDPDAMHAWSGLRPMTAQGIPYLGPTSVPGLFLHLGGGHLGWTFACGAACLVRDRLLGHPPALPIEPFALP
jgi:D-amino-acid dehydrogenase